MTNSTVTVCTRLSRNMLNEMREITKAQFLNEADFFRAAIRDAIFKYKTSKIWREYQKDKDSVKAVKKLRRLTTDLFTDKEYEKWIKDSIKDMPR